MHEHVPFMHTAGLLPEPQEEATIHGQPLRGMSDHGDIIREPAQTALYTIIRDKDTSRGNSLFYSDRIIRLLVEEGLNHLAVVKRTVTTPAGMTYEGIKFEGKICGMSILWAGKVRHIQPRSPELREENLVLDVITYENLIALPFHLKIGPRCSLFIISPSNYDTMDTVEPAPLYNVEYSTPFEDIGMAGFSHTRLATIFEEDEDGAVE
ncbi:hypothetical protein EDD18DRAFT_1109973 [Armillaria luteobubalina]|uniref:Phosphoribosyltransferase domain-containing protein n=1 Tax=Armillaria luteobubalina TaxID=153913 RepID=A0AA39UJ55_9AGAR|nr:hypothetical protein EDD18DRAFT_1109973 [Armillaria luteobubalina]